MARTTTKKAASAPADEAPTVALSTRLQIFDIPLSLIDGDALNPNEMSEEKFDVLVQEIEESGFDEPIQVIPHPRAEGRFLIAGGHHRKKAAAQLGWSTIPAVIKDSWTEDQQKLALVKRNLVHGVTDKQKFTQLYNELAKTYDPKLLQTMMGFTEKKEFETLYEGVEKNLTTKQRKVLAKSKEKIKSVDDLTAVLHKIFQEEGSESDHSYVVFTAGSKKHHYIQISDEAEKELRKTKTRLEERGVPMGDLINQFLRYAATATLEPAVKAPAKTKKRPVRIKKD